MRLFNDYSDRADFFARGSWLPTGSAPYRDVMSEYPQVATYLFGLLYLPFLGQGSTGSLFLSYSLLFSFVMLSLYAALAWVLDGMLSAKKRALVLALFLPAPLYFAYNRFDVLPSLLVVVALAAVQRRRWGVTGILLGVASLTKWYPALLVLPIAKYMHDQKVGRRCLVLFLGLFFLTCALIILPTYLTGGPEAVLAPYIRYDQSRGFDLAAFPALIGLLLGQLAWHATDAVGQIVFFVLQISVLPVIAFATIHTFEKLLCWCLLTTSVFMLFSRIYSPQWLLWILPLMILLARDKRDLSLIVVYGTLTYLEYPVLFVGYGLNANAMIILGWMNVILLAWIILRVSRRLDLLRPRPVALVP